MTFIPHSRPMLGASEIESLGRVIQSGMIAQGKMTARFEKRFCETFGLGRGASVSSGTAGLHLALLALEVGPGDEVIIPSFVCAALLNAVNYVGATPVPADIDPETFNIDPRDIEQRISPRTKAMIVPHLFGLPADMDGLLKLDIPIIEDCAQAVGGQYKGRPLGTFGLLAVFSFYATKVMTTGEGGMVTSRDERLIERIRDLREYDNREEYRLRYNYKMSDIQAALGLSQLKRLDEFIPRRRLIAQRYAEALDRFNIIRPLPDPGCIFFRYVVRVPDDAGPWIALLSRESITCARPVFKPIHKYLGLDGYPQSEAAWLSALSVPIYPSLSDNEVECVIGALVNCMEKTMA
jgi:dTDP-4-amino-4,6-dideoxygalactose transaminase